MNTSVLAVVFVSVVVFGVVGVGVGPRVDATDTPTHESVIDDDLGGDISAFMQRGAAETNESVDSGMWLAAFDTAANQSRKQALVSQRAAVLRVRLDRLETRIEQFSTAETNRSVAARTQRVRLVADRNALRTSIAEAKTTAAGEGVNATGFDRLDRRVMNLTVPHPVADRTPTAAHVGTNATSATRDESDVISVEDHHAVGVTYGGP